MVKGIVIFAVVFIMLVATVLVEGQVGDKLQLEWQKVLSSGGKSKYEHYIVMTCR